MILNVQPTFSVLLWEVCCFSKTISMGAETIAKSQSERHLWSHSWRTTGLSIHTLHKLSFCWWLESATILWIMARVSVNYLVIVGLHSDIFVNLHRFWIHILHMWCFCHFQQFRVQHFLFHLLLFVRIWFSLSK